MLKEKEEENNRILYGQNSNTENLLVTAISNNEILVQSHEFLKEKYESLKSRLSLFEKFFPKYISSLKGETLNIPFVLEKPVELRRAQSFDSRKEFSKEEIEEEEVDHKILNGDSIMTLTRENSQKYLQLLASELENTMNHKKLAIHLILQKIEGKEGSEILNDNEDSKNHLRKKRSNSNPLHYSLLPLLEKIRFQIENPEPNYHTFRKRSLSHQEEEEESIMFN